MLGLVGRLPVLNCWKIFSILNLVLFSACGFVPGLASEDIPTQPQPTSLSGDAVRPPSSYDFDIANGLYATIAGPNSFKAPELKNEERIKLNCPKAKKEVEARVLWQDKPAPLVVILPGLSMSAKDPEVRLWASTLFKAGNTVLIFDSPYRSNFNEATQLGVTCNVEAEARVCADLIQCFVNNSRAKGKITRVGLFGASYGGILALNLNRVATIEHDKYPLTFDRVLVFSPPVSLKTATAQLDRYQAERQQNGYSVDLFQEMQGLKPVPKGAPMPFTDEQMRAALGYYFHEQLMPTVLFNNSNYKLNLLEQETGREHEVLSDSELSTVASTWTYARYINEMVVPYWQKQGRLTSVDDLWRMGSVENLLSSANTNVRVVLTEDDPLNDPEELRALKVRYPSPLLTVQPCGGHLGYIGCKWALERMTNLFE